MNNNQYPKFFVPVHTRYDLISFIRRESPDGDIKVKYKGGDWITCRKDSKSHLTNPVYFRQTTIEEVALL